MNPSFACAGILLAALCGACSSVPTPDASDSNDLGDATGTYDLWTIPDDVPHGHAVDPTQVARACALEISCLGAAAPLAPGSECADIIARGIELGVGPFIDIGTLQHILDCGAVASDCTAALECASYHHGPDYCAAHPSDSCDGDILVHCISTTSWTLLNTDCASYGEHCRVVDGFGECTTDIPCSEQTSQDRCDGPFFLQCLPGGTLSRRPCPIAVAGGTCTPAPTEGSCFYGCTLPTGASCTGSAARCNGNIATQCVCGNELTTDCTVINGTCQTSADGGVACVTTAQDCHAGDPDRCNGNSLEICVNGRFVPVDCTTIGLRTCGAGAGAARCVM